MTIKEACAEIRAIGNNMSLYYSEHYDDAASAEQIIEDLEETIRQFHEIISKMKSMTGQKLAQKLHEAYDTIEKVENVIMEAFRKHEPEIYKKLDFEISADWYDNSIEIYFLVSLPYPYEPCAEIRKEIYALGFDEVYWNFTKDTMDVECDRIVGIKSELKKDSPDEIRGWEPRHNKYAHWEHTDYG
jgi:hypothetical protein